MLVSILTECDSTNGAYKPFNIIDYYDHFEAISLTHPSFLPEFKVVVLILGEAQKVDVQKTPLQILQIYYIVTTLDRVTAMSLYMLFGGTNWDWLGAPFVATSYDYSSPISENRMINEKYAETKFFDHFLRVAKDLTKIDRIGTNQTASTLAIPISQCCLFANSQSRYQCWVLQQFIESQQLEPEKNFISTLIYQKACSRSLRKLS